MQSRFKYLSFLVVGAVSFLSFSYAQETEIKKDPHHQGLLSTVNVGVRFSSLLESRGVIFYRDFQIDPVLALFFLDDRLEFLGDSIGYRDFVAGKWLRLRTRFVSVSDNPLFPSRASVKNSYPDRIDTYEWNSRAEFFISGYDENYIAEFDVGYAKDVSAHEGQYLDLQTKVKILRFRLPFAGTLIEPNFYANVGWGDSAHNQYFYGLNRSFSGFNNYSYGIWFAFPEEADRFYPIVQVKHFQALGKFKDGDFSTGRSNSWLISFIATVGVW